MPAFEDVDGTAYDSEGIKFEACVSVEFEAFCSDCGAGICNNVDTRISRRRSRPQITVECCQKCLETAREEGRDQIRDELQKEIDDLNEYINELKSNHPILT